MSRHTKLANTAQSTIILNIQRATLGDFKNSQSAAKGFPEYLNYPSVGLWRFTIYSQLHAKIL